MAGGHPTDEDRAAAALPALRELVHAARSGDREVLRALYREDVTWLGDGVRHEGPVAAADRHLELASRASAWDEPQQQGAKAVLRWSGADGARGAVIVEMRAGRVVFAAEA